MTGVIFFNNVGYLGMCGHGTIGVDRDPRASQPDRAGHAPHRDAGRRGHRALYDEGEVEVANVPSYRHLATVTVDVPGLGPVTGDVAWGGNWFFLVNDHGQQLTLDNLDA